MDKYITVAGTDLGEAERKLLYGVADRERYCAGELVAQFEKEFAEFMGMRYCSLVNSGSSANLLALSALELPKGSEVITCATGFPTTVNPIIQCGLVPDPPACSCPCRSDNGFGPACERGQTWLEASRAHRWWMDARVGIGDDNFWICSNGHHAILPVDYVVC